MAPGASQPPEPREASARSARPCAVGRIEEDERRAAAICRRAEIGGIAAEDLGDAGEAQRLDVAADEARAPRRSSSTNRQKAAPRDSASRPSAPVPANRSSTLAPSSSKSGMPCARMLKTDSRTRSEVGRVPSSRRRGQRPAAEVAADDPHAQPLGLRGGLGRAARPSLVIVGQTPSSAARRAPSCSIEHAPLHRLDRAGLQVEQLERPEGDADQPVHGQPEAFQDRAHLAVLALAQADA